MKGSDRLVSDVMTAFPAYIRLGRTCFSRMISPDVLDLPLLDPEAVIAASGWFVMGRGRARGGYCHQSEHERPKAAAVRPRPRQDDLENTVVRYKITSQSKHSGNSQLPCSQYR
jgi:hypothetical protein